MKENIKLYNGDCLEIMSNLIKDGVKVDLIITDPPYKITARGNGGNSGGMFQKKEVNNDKVFANNDIEIEDWLPLLYNILNDNSHCYIMTNNKNITKYLNTIDTMYFNGDKKQKFHFIKNLIWVKDNKIMGQTYMSQFEYIIMVRKGGPAGFRKNWDKMFAQMKRPKSSYGNVISFDRQMEVCREFLEEG